MIKLFARTASFALFAAVVLFADARAAGAQNTAAAGTAGVDSAQKLEAVRIHASQGTYGASSTRTATKTSALLRDVPQSITTVTSALVRDQGMKSLADVVRFVPGVLMGQGEGNRDQPTIRGNSTTADFFVDGTRDDAQYFRDLYNLERVEALKGSNAMVFGRGGGGGILNRVTKEAHWITQHEVTAEAGSFGGRRVSTDLQQAVSPLVAARLNSVYENSDLFRDGVSLRRSGINPTLAFSSPSRSTRVSLGYEHFEDRRTADRGIPSLNGEPVDTDPSTFFGNADESFARIGVNTASATISHDRGKIQLRNHTRITDYDKFYQNVFPGAVSGANVSLSAYNHATGRRNIFNQTDLIFAARTGRVSHELLAGAEIGAQSTDNFRNTGYFGGTATSALVPLANPVYNGEVAFRQASSDADNKTSVRSGSLYLQDQIALSPAFRIIAGARYENFAIRFDDNRTNSERRRTDAMISPRVGLVVKPVEEASVYASYSVSFLPGSGDQFGSLTDITKALEPERFTNYEAGAKWDVAGRLSLTGAVYRLDRTNTRAVDPTDPNLIVQTGAQRSQGVEIGASGNVTTSWQIAAGAASQSARITHATAASPAGARVPFVPKTSLSLWNKYSFSPRLGAALGVIRQSEMFAAIDNKVTLPSFTRVDGALFAGIGYGLRAQVNVENIFNVKYFPTAHSNNNISPGSPREARFSVTASF